MSYNVLILRRAQKELSRIPSGDFERVKDSIKDLAQEPRPQGCRKLVVQDGWRIRVGIYRVIYEIDDSQKIVTILHVGHRRDVYS